MKRLALLLALAACSDGTEPLGDDGGREAGPLDSGVTGRLDASVSTCAPIEGVFRVVSVQGPEGFDTFEGEAELASVDPFVLRGPILPDGQRAQWVFEFDNGPGWHLDLRRTYRVELEISRRNRTEVELVLRDAVSEAMTLALWATSEERHSWPDAQVTYAPEDCVHVDACGERNTLRFTARFTDTTFSVAAGDSVLINGIMGGANGFSYVFDGFPRCAVEGVWHEGFVARRVAPVVCETLQRDVCIATPGCVLWGSEEDDPGYACRPVEDPCERHTDRDACNRPTQCRWDFGDCYCPEGEVCGCGGGPAPRCRKLCDGDVACAAGYFCDWYSVSAPQCGPPPDDAGFCERVPDSCAGAPNRLTCACDPMAGATTFANGCERRAARASGPVRGACP